MALAFVCLVGDFFTPLPMGFLTIQPPLWGFLLSFFSKQIWDWKRRSIDPNHKFLVVPAVNVVFGTLMYKKCFGFIPSLKLQQFAAPKKTMPEPKKRLKHSYLPSINFQVLFAAVSCRQGMYRYTCACLERKYWNPDFANLLHLDGKEVSDMMNESGCVGDPPWKINGWNLQITLFPKEHDFPNLHDLCSMLIFHGAFDFKPDLPTDT